MRLWRYCVAALVYDWLVYVAWTVIPIRAEEMGTTATQLGLLQTAWSMVYVASAAGMGFLADRISRSAMVRAGCLGAAVACLGLGQAAGLNHFFLLIPVLSLAASAFWPGVQSAIGTETDPSRMGRAIGLFNVMWSLGKSLGFFMAGWMTGQMGPAWALAVAASAAGAVFLFYPWGQGAAQAHAERAAVPGRAAFLIMGYAANFAAVGIARTFQIHFFKFLTESGRGTLLDRAAFFGLFLGLIYLAQTAIFGVLQRHARWAYRRDLLYAAQALLGVTGFFVPLLPWDAATLLLAPVFGLGLGFAYASSIYYSLHGPAQHGKFAGLHEAVLGAGMFLVPLLGGLAADATGDLRLPYWIAAGSTFVAIAVEEAVYRTRSRSSTNRSIVKSAPSNSPGLK